MAKFTVRTLFHPISGFVRLATLTSSAWENQKSSKFVQLPEEVLLIIADCSDLADRACLLRTCRYIHSLVEGFHYRHLNMTSSRLYYRTPLLHRTLSDRPDLISLIVSYRGALMPPNEPQPLKPKATERLKSRLLGKQMPPPSWGKIPVTETGSDRRSISIFVKAVNVRELEFMDWGSEPFDEPLREILPKMSLTSFSLPYLAESVKLCPLLRAQPKLEHLGLSGVSGRFGDLKETDMPRLKSLKATLKDAAVIVPGRPVEKFYHMLEDSEGEQTLDERLVQKLSLSSATIKTLTTRLPNPRIYNCTRNEIQILSRHLPEIEHLTLTVRAVISAEILLDEIPSFRSLRSVKFLEADLADQGRPGMSMDLGDDVGDGTTTRDSVVTTWDVLFSMLRERCPSLVNVEQTPMLSFRGCAL